MKRIASGVVAAAMMLAMSGAVLAEEGTEGTKVSAGLKMWVNSAKFESGSGGSSDKTGNAVLIGPAVEVEFSNNVFVEASYVTTATKYKLDDVETSRNDMDLAVGYRFIPNAGVYVGYRNESLKNDVGTDKASGPLVGIRGSVPVIKALSVYGDVAYLMFKDKPENRDSEQAPGVEIELGVKYAFINEVSANLGYKYESTKGKDSSDKATFTGVTLGAMYTF